MSDECSISLGRIRDKLDELTAYYRELLEDIPDSHTFASERLTRRGVEKTVELIVEAVIDAANMVISREGLEKPVDSKNSMDVLAKNKIIPKKLSAKLKEMVGFRNLLVHRYGKLDEEKEYLQIKDNHRDIAEYIKATEKYLKKSSHNKKENIPQTD